MRLTYVIWNPIDPKFNSPKLSGFRVLCHLKGSFRIVSASRGYELTRLSTCLTMSFNKASFWGVNSNFPLPYSLTEVPSTRLEIVAPITVTWTQIWMRRMQGFTSEMVYAHVCCPFKRQMSSRNWIALWSTKTTMFWNGNVKRIADFIDVDCSHKSQEYQAWILEDAKLAKDQRPRKENFTKATHV